MLIPELKVSNFQTSLDFYIRLAQFELLYGRLEEEFAMLIKDKSQIMIESLSDKTRDWKVGVLEYPFGRGMHFQIEISSIDSLYNNFKNHNYPIFFEIEEKWYLKNQSKIWHRQFLVQDPDGYLLRFFEHLDR